MELILTQTLRTRAGGLATALSKQQNQDQTELWPSIPFWPLQMTRFWWILNLAKMIQNGWWAPALQFSLLRVSALPRPGRLRPGIGKASPVDPLLQWPKTWDVEF